MLAQTGEAVIVEDLNVVVTSWNREAASLYGSAEPRRRNDRGYTCDVTAESITKPLDTRGLSKQLEKATQNETKSVSRAKNLLIVDDIPAERKLLRVQMEAAGYTVIDAVDGVEALRVLEREPVDAIISDILMPNMDGFRLCVEVRKHRRLRALPFILYTSTYDSPEDRKLARSVGADCYVTKPAPTPVLLEALREASQRVLEFTHTPNFRYDETLVLRQYSEALVRKLEEKNLELAVTNGQLQESEARFSDMLDNVQLLALMLDREGRITYCNDYLLRKTGWEREKVLGRDWFEVFVPPGHDDVRDVFAAMRTNSLGAWHHENEVLTRSGGRRLILWNNTVLRSPSGEVIGTASIGEDITDRKDAEKKIRRLNRVHAMLSGINALIVRVRDRDELFKEACRIAVEHGLFKMAWIGTVDRSTMQITPVASAGTEAEFLTLIKERFSLREDAQLGDTMSARAVREKKVIVSDETQGDSRIVFAKERIDRGIHSMAILPLLVADEAVGVLALYADEVGFFDEEELKLLTDLADDVAFAIDHIDKQERLDYLAYYDVLTGLANRGLFLERVAQYMRSAVSGGHKLALFVIDLERFKNINDTLGQSAGDALLRQVAEWLTCNVRDANLLARIGADHFALVLPEVTQEGDVARLLEKTMDAFLDHPFRLNDTVFRIAAKFGVALFPDDGANADTLFKHAEAALKKAKASGNRYLFYTQKMTERVAGKLTLENQLRQALDKSEFVLHYQPKVNLASGRITGAEALIRWNDPRTGLVPPGRFIPVLEETGMIHEVGRWALRQAIGDYLRWRSAGLAAVRIAVNVSPLQLRNPDFIAEIAQAIGIDAHAAAGLELEITESMIMEDVKDNIATLQAIRAMGVSIAIDDFGTGFSSLGYLSKLPVDTLKIDRSFVTDMTAEPQGLALVSTIINLAHSLKLKVVAEGVETEEQSRLLRLLNCDDMQGYLFSKPVPTKIFEEKFLVPPPAG